MVHGIENELDVRMDHEINMISINAVSLRVKKLNNTFKIQALMLILGNIPKSQR
jgi:hypothetical protein